MTGTPDDALEWLQPEVYRFFDCYRYPVYKFIARRKSVKKMKLLISENCTSYTRLKFYLFYIGGIINYKITTP
jgi:hypothetical protein